MIKTLQISHDPPKNLYMVEMTSGKRAGINFERIDFMVPVLGFTRPRTNNDSSWYVIIHRTTLEKDLFGHYYIDKDGIEYELVYLSIPWDGFYDFKKRHELAFVDGTNYDCFLETLEYYYKECIDKLSRIHSSGEQIEHHTITDFLLKYEDFIKEKYPHILI